MKPVAPISPARAAVQLRLVQHYLPRVRAAAAHDPAVWVVARAAQQLAQLVLTTHAALASGPAGQAEHQRQQRALRQLEQVLRARYQLAPGPPRQQWEAQHWGPVQQGLHVALALAERLLLQAGAGEEKT